MTENGWGFLTAHARVLVAVARTPDARLRDIAATAGVTERRVFGIVADLADAGYVVKEKEGRRNRYHIQDHLPLRDPLASGRTIGEVLDLLVGVSNSPHRGRPKGPGAREGS
jgi:hypothetical protein